MRQKNNAVLIIIVILLTGGIGYYAFKQWSEQIKNHPNSVSIPTQEKPSIPSLPATCKDEPEGQPVITSFSPAFGPIGTKLEIKGCNFSGFEGDKNIWIKNSQGVKGLLRGEAGSTSKLLNVTLTSPLCQKDTSYSGAACDAFLTLAPGAYNIYTMPWGKKSNEVSFTLSDNQSASANKTIGWKMYQNKKYGFEFLYPPFLTLEPHSNGEINMDILSYCEKKQISPIRPCLSGSYYIRIQIFEQPFDSKDLGTWFDSKPNFQNVTKVTASGIDLYVARNAAMGLEEYLAVGSLGKRSLTISFSGDAFINPDLSATARLNKAKEVLSTLSTK